MKVDDDKYPHTLSDLQKGDSVDGDSGTDASKLPTWFDVKKYESGQRIFKRHPLNFVLTWHFSLVMGFCVKPLLKALVFTGNSSTPKTSLARYIKTYLYLAEWHLCGNMFQSDSKAYSSVQTVRKMHAAVRGNMEKTIMPQQKWMTQYDMCLVQTGFMGK